MDRVVCNLIDCMDDDQKKTYEGYSQKLKDDMSLVFKNGMPFDLVLKYGVFKNDDEQIQKAPKKRTVVYKPNRHDRRRAEALARKDRGHA